MRYSALLTAMAVLAGAGIIELVSAETRVTQSGQERATAVGRGLIGSPAPPLRIETMDGSFIDLGALYEKKTVYLKFWATWCQPCREQMPHFQRIHENAGAELVVIAVNMGLNDPPDVVQLFRRQAGLTMPLVIDDGKLAEVFNVRVTPQHVIVGRDGRIQYVGHLADERLEAALDAAQMTAPKPQSPLAQASPSAAPRDAQEHLPEMSATLLNGSVLPTDIERLLAN